MPDHSDSHSHPHSYAAHPYSLSQVLSSMTSHPASPSTTMPPPARSPSPTTSACTSDYGPPRKVLLLVDVQNNMLAPPPTGVPAATRVTRNIRRALRYARESPHPPLVIHTRNCGSAGDPDAPGTHGWALALDTLPGELVLDKRKNNAFRGTRLGELVDRSAAIVVVGMPTDFCIRATCGAALERGNTVFLVEDAHATYDRCEEYASGAGGPLLVTPAHKVEKEVERDLEDRGVFLIKVDDLPHVFTDT